MQIFGYLFFYLFKSTNSYEQLFHSILILSTGDRSVPRREIVLIFWKLGICNDHWFEICRIRKWLFLLAYWPMVHSNFENTSLSQEFFTLSWQVASFLLIQTLHQTLHESMPCRNSTLMIHADWLEINHLLPWHFHLTQQLNIMVSF